MKSIRYTLIFILFVQVCSLKAAAIDTVETYSPSMKKAIKAIIITPESYDDKKEFPTVYLLHGYSGNYRSWFENNPEMLAKLADNNELIFVCPDGDYNSWYLDSPVNDSIKYETYIATELISWVDSHYKTIKKKEGRGITGLSMGGHGALYLAFKHQDVFGVAGSMSGGVDIRPFPDNWDLASRLGDYAKNKKVWDNHSVINLVGLLTPSSLYIIFDCGTDDFFYDVNVALHRKLMGNKIPHDFISRPGAHTWDYWKNSLPYQILFMDKYFEGN